MLLLILSFCTGHRTPQLYLKDLHNHVTPNYATHWRVIGTQLGLSTGTLDIIEYDNRDKAVPCCNAMLEKWLDVDSTASWNKILSVIQSPSVSSGQTLEKGIHVCILQLQFPFTFMYI